MAKQEFRAESRRLLDLMINSIYTNKEIFLRELISNASDALDKMRFAAASDGSVEIDPSAFGITLTIDKTARTLTVSDNGIGMDENELAENLGVIAASGTKAFRDDTHDVSGAGDLIGMFGVGFYSAFMVAEHITVVSRRLGAEKAFKWDCTGAEGYTIEPAEREGAGTDVILYIRPEPEEDGDEYNKYLREYPLYKLVKKYSDYIRYPIKLLMPHPVITNEAEIEAAKQNGTEPPEAVYEEVFEYETLNSMIPLWQRPRSEVTPEDYSTFYKEHFSDNTDPMSVLPVFMDGNVSYRALLYIPAHTPADWNTDSYAAGLELYSAGVMIMKDCRQLLPEEFNFVRGVVDSTDISLNISREMLQQDRQLPLIAAGLAKKIRQELLRLLKNERDRYLEFYKHFGHHLKVCAMDDYGAKKDSLGELLLFPSGREKRMITLDEYAASMPASQKYIYYASASSVEAAANLPQTAFVLGKGPDVLFFVDKADDFISDMFRDYAGKPFRSIIDGDPELDGGSAKTDTARFKASFDFIKETLGDEVDEVRATEKLGNHPVCLSSGSGVTFEMEKYFKAIHKDAPIRAKRILEINVRHQAFLCLEEARISAPERAKAYCRILLTQAKMIAGLPIGDPGAYTDLIVSTWTRL